MNKIVDILMKRDNMTREDAKIRFNEVKNEIHEALASDDYDEVECILTDELGLEMDYIFDIL